MNDIDNITTKIQNITGENIDYQTNEYTYSESNPAKDLKDAGLIENETTKYTIISLSSPNGEKIAEIAFAIFPFENVSYIEDLWVAEKYRNLGNSSDEKGIGTLLREYVVNILSKKSSKIYSLPTNSHIKHIAKKQGFQPSSNLQGWYVRK